MSEHVPEFALEKSDDTLEAQPPLDDEGLARLDEYLSSESLSSKSLSSEPLSSEHLSSANLGEEAPDLISAHGYLVALAVCPREIPTEQWIAELFEGEPAFENDVEREEILGLLTALKSNAGDILERGQWIELPFDTELDEDGDMAAAIEDWCAGFMQGVFLEESAWFSQDEAHVAALLLPFMALSGLFDDEPEIEEMVSEDSQFAALAGQLPELILDLYLHFRVPPEPAKPQKRKNASQSRKSSGGRQRGRKR